MIIDFHTHYGQGLSKTGFDLNFLLSEIKKGVMDKAVIFAIKDKEGVVDYRQHNKEIAEMCKGRPLIGFMRINCLNSLPNIDRNLKEGLEFGLRGIKLHPRDDGWDASAFKRICEFAEQKRLPILLHTESAYSGLANIDELVKHLRGFPNNCFVLAHARVSETVAKEIARNRSIYIDTSLYTHVLDIKRLLREDEEAYKQLLFASDYPFGLPSYEKQKLVEIFSYLGMSKHLPDVLGGNAQKLLGLKTW
ncbi:amidohydrolase family protein [Candidatus Woesearchaeota archaeon]|nr:amidohydrolase family protein [Candidatus Woesearchaeota archaeon]